MTHAVANALIAKVHKLEAKLQEVTNLSNARRKWWDKAREREKQVRTENKRLKAEMLNLQKLLLDDGMFKIADAIEQILKEIQ